MEKTDFKKQDKAFYGAKAKRFEIVELPEWRFLSIEGEGDPNNSPGFATSVTALYALSYPLKFHSKNVHGRDYVVGPLEGLWWADDWETFARGERDKWKWRLLLRQPAWQQDEDVELARSNAIAKARKAGETALAEHLGQVRVENFAEGLCVQVLHVGPFSEEGPLIAQMHDEFMPENGLAPRGLHHEIYLSDMRRVAPEKLRTILRQPVVRGKGN